MKVYSKLENEITSVKDAKLFLNDVFAWNGLSNGRQVYYEFFHDGYMKIKKEERPSCVRVRIVESISILLQDIREKTEGKVGLKELPTWKGDVTFQFYFDGEKGVLNGGNRNGGDLIDYINNIHPEIRNGIRALLESDDMRLVVNLDNHDASLRSQYRVDFERLINKYLDKSWEDDLTLVSQKKIGPNSGRF